MHTAKKVLKAQADEDAKEHPVEKESNRMRWQRARLAAEGRARRRALP